MRKVWLILALFLIVLPGVVVFVTLNPLAPMEAASQATETPAVPPAFKAGGSGYPLVETTQQGYDNHTPEDAPILLRQAPFVPFGSAEQQAWGNVQHRMVGAKEILHLTPNFKVSPGLSAEIVLTASDNPSAAEIAALPALAKPGATAGVQEFAVPAEREFGAVAIYDRSTDVVLAIAKLEPEPVCAEIPARYALASSPPADAPHVCVAINETAALNETGSAPEVVDIAAYRLSVGGAVDNPLSLTFDDLKQFPSTAEVVLLVCSGFFADNVEWTGVPLSIVLEVAQVKPDYRAIRVESGSDGYYVTLDKGVIDPADVILAYQVNGEDIPLKHGYPVRLVIRDVYGSKWVKWVKDIQVLPQ